MIWIERMLSDEALGNVQKAYDTLDFVSGEVTAGRNVKEKKRNLQADPKLPATERLAKFVRDRINERIDFQMACQPRRLSGVTFNRFGEGDYYRPHLDNVIHGQGVRADISATVWLSEPEDYEGGELVLYDGPSAVRRYKQRAGDAIFYPANLVHEVQPVTQGERRAGVFWIESRVRDHERRQLLFDLWCGVQVLDKEQHAELMRLMRVHNGLVRRWRD